MANGGTKNDDKMVDKYVYSVYLFLVYGARRCGGRCALVKSPGVRPCRSMCVRVRDEVVG